MASELQVTTIRGVPTGANANQILVPTGQKFIATDTGSIVAPGQVIQLVHTSYATENALTNTTWADTNLQLSITPKFNTSKIYVLYIMQFRIYSPNSDTGLGFRLLRNGTVIEQAVTTYDNYIYDGGGQTEYRGQDTETYLDSPATTSALTYKIQANPYSGTVRVQSDNNRSRMTLMEIAG